MAEISGMLVFYNILSEPPGVSGKPAGPPCIERYAGALARETAR
jgi:hypothetical protein